MGLIIIKNHRLTFDQIKNGNWPSLSSYFEASLNFCKDWLNEKQNFQLQTSGSTGKPKIIPVTRRQMQYSAEATGKFFALQTDAQLLCCLNTSMIAGKMMLVRAMVWNCTLFLEEPSGTPLENFPKDQSFDFVAMVPAQIENCLLNNKAVCMLQNIANLIIGGAPLSQQTQQAISQLPCKAYQTYGMTETVSHIALAKITGKPPLVYRSLPGVKISTTPSGQLTIDAPMALETLITNDIVEIISENQFVWKGRADFTINSGGIKIQPEILEAKISPIMAKYLPQSRYFISGRPSKKWGEEIILIVESSPSGQLEKTLNDAIALVAGKYEKPKKIYFLENFTETPSGKIKRKDNLKMVLEKP